MKKRLFPRIMAGLSGVLLVLLALAAAAETFFHVPVSTMANHLLNKRTPLAVLITVAIVLVLLALGVGCLMSLFRGKNASTAGFVLQKGENGLIGVSIRAIEGLVKTCVRQYAEVSSAEVSIAEKRDGIVVMMRIEEATGISIPLSVGALQKQIKQYVSTCTGVDVQEVRVLVESNERTIAESPYAVKEPVLLSAAVPVVEAAKEPVAEAAVVVAEEAAPAEADEATADDAAEAPPAASVVIPAMPDVPDEADDRPLHQRLFGTEEQIAFVPAPPQLAAQSAEEAPAEEEAEPAADASAVEDVESADEETDPTDEAEDAVAEVARAVTLDSVANYEASEADEETSEEE